MKKKIKTAFMYKLLGSRTTCFTVSSTISLTVCSSDLRNNLSGQVKIRVKIVSPVFMWMC